MCLSSRETTVFVRHLVVVILYGWLSGMQVAHPAYQTVTHTLIINIYFSRLRVTLCAGHVKLFAAAPRYRSSVFISPLLKRRIQNLTDLTPVASSHHTRFKDVCGSISKWSLPQYEIHLPFSAQYMRARHSPFRSATCFERTRLPGATIIMVELDSIASRWVRQTLLATTLERKSNRDTTFVVAILCVVRWRRIWSKWAGYRGSKQNQRWKAC
jgi:hypothetical protein